MTSLVTGPNSGPEEALVGFRGQCSSSKNAFGIGTCKPCEGGSMIYQARCSPQIGKSPIPSIHSVTLIPPDLSPSCDGSHHKPVPLSRRPARRSARATRWA